MTRRFEHVRTRLLQVDGILVWVDPVSEYGDRCKLDPMLEDIAARGVWVSAHPDIIRKIGTKEVLFRTKHFSWGTDTHIYATEEQFRKQFPALLRSSGPRVTKQRRGTEASGRGRQRSSATAPIRWFAFRRRDEEAPGRLSC